MAKDIFDAVYGCLIAGAIGDALGAPIEGWYWTDIRAKYGKLDKFLPHRSNPSGLAGSCTDDTTLRQLICLAIIRKGGRITPDDLGTMFREKANMDRFWHNERLVMEKLKIGMNPWETGRGTPPAGCASMAIVPVGVINAGDPVQAYQDAFNLASFNQDGINRDAAASLAAAQAVAMVPGATVDEVVESMFTYASDLFRRAMILTMDLAKQSKSVDDFCERFYNSKLLDWTWPQPNWKPDRHFSGSSIEFVPVVPAILWLCKGDVNACIIEGANFGRDCDTIGSIVGSLAGTMQGASAVSKEWIEPVEKANEQYFVELEGDPKANFRATAERLVEALRNERRKTAEKAAKLDQVLAWK